MTHGLKRVGAIAIQLAHECGTEKQSNENDVDRVRTVIDDRTVKATPESP